MNYEMTTDAAGHTYSVTVTLTERELAADKNIPDDEGFPSFIPRHATITGSYRFVGECFDGYRQHVDDCMSDFRSLLEAEILESVISGLKLPELKGDAPRDAQFALHIMLRDYVRNSICMGTPPSLIQSLLDTHFGDLIVERSAPKDWYPYMHLFWPDEFEVIKNAVLGTLGHDAMHRMEAWVREHYHDRAIKAGPGLHNVFLFRDTLDLSPGDPADY